MALVPYLTEISKLSELLPKEPRATTSLSDFELLKGRMKIKLVDCVSKNMVISGSFGSLLL